MKRYELPPVKVFHLRALPLGLAAMTAGLLFVSTDVWWLAVVLIGASAVAITLATVFAKRRRGVGVFCLVCLLLSLLAVVRTFAVADATIGARSSAMVEGRIEGADVDEDGKVSAIVLDGVRVGGERVKGRVRVTLNGQTSAPFGYVYADAFGSDYVVGVPIEIGQTASVRGAVTPVSGGYYDSYAMHCKVRRVYHTVRAETCEIVDNSPRQTAAEKVRAALYRNLRADMSGRTAGFAYAFLTGDSSYAADEVLEGFRATGTAHLLAVSGLHVGILAGLLLWLFKRFRMPAWAETLALSAVLGVYAWLCSATPSVLRASIVAVSFSLTRALGVHRDKPSLLAMAALLLLTVNPLWLFDVSFLLSYAAFAGIVLLYSPVRALLRKVPGKWGDALSLNLAVTASTLPMTVYFFGGFSALAVPLNFLLVPVMSALYPVLMIFAGLSFIPSFGILLTLLDVAFVAVTDAVVRIGGVGYLRCAVGVGQLPLYYGAVALVSPYCLLRPKWLRYALAGAAVLAVVLWSVLATFV